MPMWAESAERTSWHPGHIAERYGLFTIIVLGESVLAATVGGATGARRRRDVGGSRGRGRRRAVHRLRDVVGLLRPARRARHRPSRGVVRRAHGRRVRVGLPPLLRVRRRGRDRCRARGGRRSGNGPLGAHRLASRARPHDPGQRLPDRRVDPVLPRQVPARVAQLRKPDRGRVDPRVERDAGAGARDRARARRARRDQHRRPKQAQRQVRRLHGKEYHNEVDEMAREEPMVASRSSGHAAGKLDEGEADRRKAGVQQRLLVGRHTRDPRVRANEPADAASRGSRHGTSSSIDPERV